MKEFLKRAIEHRAVGSLFGISFFLVAGGWTWAYWALRNVEPYINFHWNADFGIKQVVFAGDFVPMLGTVGGTTLFVVVVNTLVALELEERDWFLGKLLAVGTLAISALIFIGFAAIIAVN